MERSTIQTAQPGRTRARRPERNVLRETEGRRRRLFGDVPVGLYRATADGRIIDVNRALLKMLGCDSVSALAGRSLDHFIADPDAANSRRTLLASDGKLAGFIFPLTGPSGAVRFVAEDALIVKPPDGPAYCEGSIQDVTEKKAAEERLLYNAMYDELSGLPNRALFREQLGKAWNQWVRQADRQFAVLFLDLDGFKQVNDSAGHQAGDLLLRAAAERLVAAVRPGDTVARLGGDEFAILLEGLGDVSIAVQVAERCRRSLDAPFDLGGRDMRVGASIGIAMIHSRYRAADELLRDADIAMYRAKARGRRRFEVFEPAMRMEPGLAGRSRATAGPREGIRNR